MKLSSLVAVFIGSGLGGVCRFGCSHWIQSLAPHVLFPWNTFIVNVVGCFLIGLLYGLFDHSAIVNHDMRLLLTVGFCGGFTTFSTFINESYMLFSHATIQSSLLTLGYLLASITMGFCMLYLGYKLVS